MDNKQLRALVEAQKQIELANKSNTIKVPTIEINRGKWEGIEDNLGQFFIKYTSKNEEGKTKAIRHKIGKDINLRILKQSSQYTWYDGTASEYRGRSNEWDSNIKDSKIGFNVDGNLVCNNGGIPFIIKANEAKDFLVEQYAGSIHETYGPSSLFKQSSAFYVLGTFPTEDGKGTEEMIAKFSIPNTTLQAWWAVSNSIEGLISENMITFGIKSEIGTKSKQKMYFATFNKITRDINVDDIDLNNENDKVAIKMKDILEKIKDINEWLVNSTLRFFGLTDNNLLQQYYLSSKENSPQIEAPKTTQEPQSSPFVEPKKEEEEEIVEITADDLP